MKVFVVLLTAALGISSVIATPADKANACCDAECSVPLLRAYAGAPISDHFYTISAPEMIYAATHGYHFEGVQGYVYRIQAGATVPLYRSYNQAAGDHFYTTSKPEHDNAAKVGYKDEGIAAYIYDKHICDTVPLYRLWSATRADHFYTISETERANAITKFGYKDEGIVGYVLPKQG